MNSILFSKIPIFLFFLDIVKPRNSVQSQRKAYITREVMRITQKQQIQKPTIISWFICPQKLIPQYILAAIFNGGGNHSVGQNHPTVPNH